MDALDRNAPISDWIAAAQAAGVPREPGCPFYVWAEGREDRPLREIESAPVEVILEAATTGLRIDQGTDKEFFVQLIEGHSNSEAVKRWARAQ